jgi:hypothetical protein
MYNPRRVRVGLVSRVLGGVLIIGLGVTAMVVAANAPRLLRATRPALRQGLKRGIEAYAAVRGAAAELAEDIEDLVAEVQAELKPTTAPGARSQSQDAKEA